MASAVSPLAPKDYPALPGVAGAAALTAVSSQSKLTTTSPSNPPGVAEMLTQKKVITVLMSPDEERKWQRQFDQLFKGR